MKERSAFAAAQLRRRLRLLMRDWRSATIGGGRRWLHVRAAAITLLIALATAVAAQQVQALQTLGSKVSDLRQSRSSGPDRAAELSLLEPQLSDAERVYLLQADSATVASVFKNAEDILQALMTSGIKPETRNSAADTAVTRANALGLDRSGASAVASLVRDYLRPNYQSSETATKRQQAQDAVPPVFATVASGETIIRKGDVVTPFQLEEAQQVGLLAPRADWSRIMATLILVLVLFALALGYLIQFRPGITRDPRQLLMLGGLVLAIVLIARVVVPIDRRAQYAVPRVAVPIRVAELMDTGLGIGVAFAVGPPPWV